MVKKLLIGCFVLFLGLIAVYAVWVSRPPIQDRAYIEGVLAQVEERLEKERALTPAENGYRSERLLPYWGRENKEYQPDSQVESVVAEWQEYAHKFKGEIVPHEQLLSNEEYRGKRDAFATQVDEIKEAFEKPFFTAVPEERPSFLTVGPNFAAFRAVAQATNSYAESLIGEDKFEEAISLYAAVLNTGKVQQKSGVLINTMIAVSIQAIALDSIRTYIPPQTPMKWEKFSALSDALLQAVAPRESFRDALQHEVARGVWYFEDVKEGKVEHPDLASEMSPSKLSITPGYWKREERLYWNAALELLQGVENQDLSEFNRKMENFSFTAWLQGEMGLLASIAFPSTERAYQSWVAVQKELVATALAYRLIGSREKDGSYATLEELKAGSPELKSALERFPGVEVISEQSKVYVKNAFKEPWEQSRLQAPLNASWVEKRNGEGIFYNLGE